MRIRTMAGIAVAGAAATAAIIGGVAYATADEAEPTVRIVTEEASGGAAQQERDCPEEGGGSDAAPSPEPQSTD